MPLTQHPTALVHQAEADTANLYPESLMNPSTNQDDPVECVGSLLVHTSDVQELSESPPEPKDEMVGSLLVSQKDVQELTTEADATATKTVNLAKRLTERITEDVQTKPDDYNPWSNQKEE